MLLPFAGALADWDVGDPALYYQLPDSTGWDVYSEWGTGPLASEGYGAADDWTADDNRTYHRYSFLGLMEKRRCRPNRQNPYSDIQ